MENTSPRPVSREEKAAAEMGNRLLDFIECLEARILESDIVSWQFTDLTDAAHILLLIAGPRWPSTRATTISSGSC